MSYTNLLVLCALIFCFALPRVGLCSTDPSCLSIEVLDMESYIFILLKNNCLSPIEVDGGFSLGGKNAISPMKIDIYDQKGRRHEVKGEVDAGILNQRVLLQKQQIFGSQFSKEMIKHYYSVNSGTYRLEATYLLREPGTFEVRDVVRSERKKISL